MAICTLRLSYTSLSHQAYCKWMYINALLLALSKKWFYYAIICSVIGTTIGIGVCCTNYKKCLLHQCNFFFMFTYYIKWRCGPRRWRCWGYHLKCNCRNIQQYKVANFQLEDGIARARWVSKQALPLCKVNRIKFTSVQGGGIGGGWSVRRRWWPHKVLQPLVQLRMPAEERSGDTQELRWWYNLVGEQQQTSDDYYQAIK